MIRLCALGALLVGALLSGCATQISGGPRFYPQPASTGDYNIPIVTLQEARFQNVIRQRYDFSCGSAALATLLKFHYGRPRTEEETFLGMWRDGDREQIRKLGFSLLDMKRYLAAEGLRADGFRVTLEQVVQTGVPGIVLINLGGYRHFVVVKAISENQILVGDPSLGLRTMNRKQFEASWNGIYFAINEQAATARASFGDPQWAYYPRIARPNQFGAPLSLQELYLTAPQVLGGPLIREF